MSACCAHGCASSSPAPSARFRRILWIALAVNAAMFVVEIVAGLRSQSVSLLADAVDFAGDAANYGLSLAVLSMGALWRARAAWVKGLTMALYGGFVLMRAGWVAVLGIVPEPLTMGMVAMLALVANVSVAWLLYRYREGDANMRSVWLCSRNDAIANVAIGVAALGVFGSDTAWPDLAVAGLIAVLALSAGISVIRQARAEIVVARRAQVQH